MSQNPPAVRFITIRSELVDVTGRTPDIAVQLPPAWDPFADQPASELPQRGDVRHIPGRWQMFTGKTWLDLTVIEQDGLLFGSLGGLQRYPVQLTAGPLDADTLLYATQEMDDALGRDEDDRELVAAGRC